MSIGQESVECFEKVLMNLNNIQLTPEEIQFAIMNYRTITKCDFGNIEKYLLFLFEIINIIF